MMCRLYGVTRAGFYAWRSRERSERERQNQTLTEAIRSVHAQSEAPTAAPGSTRCCAGMGTGRASIAWLD